jgi:hypothetical protein
MNETYVTCDTACSLPRKYCSVYNRRIYYDVMQSISRQRTGKHVPAATIKHIIIELLFETVLSARSVQSGYLEDNWGDPLSC